MKPSAAKALRSTQVNTIAPAPSGAGIDVLVLTEDDFFLLAVRRVVTLPNRVWHATSQTQAADMLLSSPCAVALIDLALVQNQLEQVMTRLREVLPDLGFVAAGEPEEQTRLTRFLHHDGGEEDNPNQLDNTLAAADLVICQTGCISHDAYWRVKDHCKRTGKRCVFVDTPSRSSLERALQGLQPLLRASGKTAAAPEA